MSWLAARILGVSVWAPGLAGWAASRDVLAGAADYVPTDSPAPAPAILSPNERRRAGPVTRLALAVASEAAAMSGLSPDTMRGVFASANGDGLVVGSILQDLSQGGDQVRLVSPTQFHNSVHNATAGYWSIATANRQPITCVACHDFTWPAALLTAMAEVATHGAAVLLCVYDHPMPSPLDAARPLAAPFGVALVLAPAGPGGEIAGGMAGGQADGIAGGQAGGMAGIRLRFMPAGSPAAGEAGHFPAASAGIDALRALADGNPAARALPLLEALARGTAGSHTLAYLDGRLDVAVTA